MALAMLIRLQHSRILCLPQQYAGAALADLKESTSKIQEPGRDAVDDRDDRDLSFEGFAEGVRGTRRYSR